MFVLVLALTVSLTGGQNSRLMFHLDSSVPDPDGGAKDLSVSTAVLRTFNSIFCHGSVGDRFVVRIDPSSAHMEIIDRSVRFTNMTPGIDSCMPASNRVQCSSVHVCTSGNTCVINLAIDCGQLRGPAKWDRTPQIEATLADVHGELVLNNCFVMCLDSGYIEESQDTGQHRMSYTTIALIVSGVVLVAALVVGGCVFYKIKVMRKMEPTTHPQIQFAK